MCPEELQLSLYPLADDIHLLYTNDIHLFLHEDFRLSVNLIIANIQPC